MIPIAELEQDLTAEEAFEEFETADTVEVDLPVFPPSDQDEEGPTGVYFVKRG